MERKLILACASLLLLAALVGCETMRPLNPMSRSHGLPPQFEGESAD